MLRKHGQLLWNTIYVYMSELQLFWYDWHEKLKVDLDDFWLVHFIILYAYVTQQKFPNTLLYIRGHIRYSSGNVPLKVLFNGKTSNNSLKLYAVKIPRNKGRVTFCSETNRMVQNITHFDPLLAEISHKKGESTFCRIM